MFRSNPIIDRFIKFLSLPSCFLEVIENKECKKSRFGIVVDLLELFFSYKTFPSHYGPCRLWEIEKSRWKYYYGSHLTYQRLKLRSKLQPSEYLILFRDKTVCEFLYRGIGVNNLPHTYGTLYTDFQREFSAMFKENDNAPLQTNITSLELSRNMLLKSFLEIFSVFKQNDEIK